MDTKKLFIGDGTLLVSAEPNNLADFYITWNKGSAGSNPEIIYVFSTAFFSLS